MQQICHYSQHILLHDKESSDTYFAKGNTTSTTFLSCPNKTVNKTGIMAIILYNVSLYFFHIKYANITHIIITNGLPFNNSHFNVVDNPISALSITDNIW